MKSTISVAIDERTLEVVRALMDQRHISRSEALNTLAWQGVLRLKELSESEAKA